MEASNGLMVPEGCQFAPELPFWDIPVLVKWSVGKARIGISSANLSLVPRGEVWNIFAPVSEERGVVAEHITCYAVAFQDVDVDPTA
jgi:hypothetical protein